MTAVATKPTTSVNTSKTQGSEPKFAPQPRVAFWKPNRDKKGAMASIEFSSGKQCFFLKMMPESGQESPKFDTNKAINAKLGLNDIGEILAVLVGKKEGLGRKDDKGYWTGLYHDGGEGRSSSIGLSRGENGLFLSLSNKREGNVTRYNIGITAGESEIMRVFFENYVTTMFLEQQQSE